MHYQMYTTLLARRVQFVLYRPGTDKPTGIQTWVDSTLRVASQHSNQFGQRVRPAGDKPAGRLDCHSGNTHFTSWVILQFTRTYVNLFPTYDKHVSVIVLP